MSAVACAPGTSVDAVNSSAIANSPFMVGVSGHRDLDADQLPLLREAVASFVRQLKEYLPDTDLHLIVGMAEGADLLVAGHPRTAVAVPQSGAPLRARAGAACVHQLPGPPLRRARGARQGLAHGELSLGDSPLPPRARTALDRRLVSGAGVELPS